jgi:hypothetical protein
MSRRPAPGLGEEQTRRGRPQGGTDGAAAVNPSCGMGKSRESWEYGTGRWREHKMMFRIFLGKKIKPRDRTLAA